MLKASIIADICSETEDAMPSFIKKHRIHLDRGKEIGHKYSEKIEEDVVDHLASIWTKEVTRPLRSREFGDVYFLNNAINIKFSTSSGGQPNICSFARAYEKYCGGEIDSYYILMITLDGNDRHKFKVKMWNLFDIPELLHFDFGTGQLMLKKTKFSYIDVDKIEPKCRKDVLSSFYKIAKDSYQRHEEITRNKMDKYKMLMVESRGS